ncbi:MAG: hypothetical protein HN909_01420 [Phycisphaerales bacterium]|jgi:hypothetical protein|nr:hypothetical protein [Phycisphaerales bacterium]MBT7170408.1 hypothetical protein [Phycisphaerales bacterium]
MDLFLYLVLAALPVVLYVAISILPHMIRRTCPECEKRGLRWCSESKGLFFEEGRAVRAHRAYYVCEKCDQAYVRRNKGDYEVLSSESRHQYIDDTGKDKSKPKK